MTLPREDIEAVAKSVVELLQDEVPEARKRPGRLVDAATAARLLGVSRATVYAKADELGAIRVGNGKRARLRFDPSAAVGRQLKRRRWPGAQPSTASKEVIAKSEP